MESKFHYILSQFKNIYNLDDNNIDLNYGFNGTSKIQIKMGDTSFFIKREKYDISKTIWKEWKSVRIPFLFDSSNDMDIISFSDGNLLINFDIIASSFFFLSNWQESQYEHNPILRRFPFEESIQYKLNITDKPVVNYYFDILREAIEKAYSIQLKFRLWEGHSLSTFVSHDVDTCQSAWLQGGFRALKKGDLITPIKLLFKKIFQKDAWFNFEYILKKEKKFGIQSTFFFLSRKGKYGKFRNSDYNIKKMWNVFRLITANNSEIGIHGSIGTCYDVYRFQDDIKEFNIIINGNRFHYLEFDPSFSIEVLEKSKLKYDTSLGFAEHYGFRNGFCFPFYLYDITKNKESEILEIPLILMDGTLQNKKYMNLNKEQIIKHISSLINEITKFHGLFTILWHNTHFSDYKYKGWGEIYDEIIELCIKNNSCFLNGQEILAKYDGAITKNTKSRG